MNTFKFAGLEFRPDYPSGDACSLTTFDTTTVERLQDALLEVVDMWPFCSDEWILNGYDEDANLITLKLYPSDEYFCSPLSIDYKGEVKKIDNVFAYNEVRKKYYV